MSNPKYRICLQDGESITGDEVFYTEFFIAMHTASAIYRFPYVSVKYVKENK